MAIENKNTDTENSKLKNQFNKALNSHGYAFQHAVIQAAKTAYERGSSCWIFEASEFPVEVNGQNTRIDFILQSNDKDHNYCLVAECKRVNPALGNWCFVKAPIVRRNCSTNLFTIECLKRDKYEKPLKTQTCSEICLDNFSYHIGIAVKNDTKGDAQGKNDRDATEQAASQVCRGVNGMIQLGVNVKDLVLFNKDFIPVIFTTASLWASDCDLSRTDLTDGNIDLSEDSFEKKPWLLYQYHLGPGIKHSVESHEQDTDLSFILASRYIRTVLIVNANHVSDFLSWLNPHHFFE